MLIVVRHGRTAMNASGLLLGRADPVLDETGRAQADATAAAVGRVDRVVSSSLRRALETAEAFGVVADVDDRWIELDYGELDGRPMAEVPESTWRLWRSDPDFAPPGGESLRTLKERVHAACDELAEQARSETVVVVTHVSPVKAALGWSLGMDERINWRSFVSPGSITRIGAGPVLLGFNEVGHLADAV